MKKKEQQLVKVESSVLSLAQPDQILQFGAVLKKYIVDNKLSTRIGDKDYAHVDAWKFAGMNFGLTAICDEPVRISGKENIHVIYAKRTVTRGQKSWDEEFPCYISTLIPSEKEEAILDKKYKDKITKTVIKEYFNYKCACRIVRLSDGITISAGFATCSNLESKKVSFDEYAVNSMSQTRSIGKGYRNLLGYVMNAAGFEATPAEEMEEQQEDAPRQSSSKSKPAVSDVKPVLTDEQFARALSQLKEGKITEETIKNHFTVTEFQQKAFDRVVNPSEDQKAAEGQAAFVSREEGAKVRKERKSSKAKK